MRQETKMGVVIAMVVVLVGGGYYIYRDQQEESIPVKQGSRSLAKSQRKSLPSSPKSQNRVAKNSPKKTIEKRTTNQDPRQARSVKTAQSDRRNQAVPTGRGTKNAGKTSASAKPIGKKTASRTKPMPTRATANRQPARNNRTTSPSERQARRGNSDRMPTPSKQRKGPGKPVSTEGSDSAKPRSLTATNGAGGEKSDEAVESHRVQAGETLASIAQSYYGDERLAPFLALKNRQLRNPRSLRPGEVVKIPARPQSDPAKGRKASSAGSSKVNKPKTGIREYEVKPGDSFYAIARDELGDSTRWKELLSMNTRIVKGDPKKLRVGQMIQLPQS